MMRFNLNYRFVLVVGLVTGLALSGCGSGATPTGTGGGRRRWQRRGERARRYGGERRKRWERRRLRRYGGTVGHGWCGRQLCRCQRRRSGWPGSGWAWRRRRGHERRRVGRSFRRRHRWRRRCGQQWSGRSVRNRGKHGAGNGGGSGAAVTSSMPVRPTWRSRPGAAETACSIPARSATTTTSSAATAARRSARSRTAGSVRTSARPACAPPFAATACSRRPRPATTATPGSGDGCSANCSTVETGWRCPVPGKPCMPICGDGSARAARPATTATRQRRRLLQHLPDRAGGDLSGDGRRARAPRRSAGTA